MPEVLGVRRERSLEVSGALGLQLILVVRTLLEGLELRAGRSQLLIALGGQCRNRQVAFRRLLISPPRKGVVAGHR